MERFSSDILRKTLNADGLVLKSCLVFSSEEVSVENQSSALCLNWNMCDFAVWCSLGLGCLKFEVLEFLGALHELFVVGKSDQGSEELFLSDEISLELDSLWKNIIVTFFSDDFSDLNTGGSLW